MSKTKILRPNIYINLESQNDQICVFSRKGEKKSQRIKIFIEKVTLLENFLISKAYKHKSIRRRDSLFRVEFPYDFRPFI